MGRRWRPGGEPHGVPCCHRGMGVPTGGWGMSVTKKPPRWGGEADSVSDSQRCGGGAAVKKDKAHCGGGRAKSGKARATPWRPSPWTPPPPLPLARAQARTRRLGETAASILGRELGRRGAVGHDVRELLSRGIHDVWIMRSMVRCLLSNVP